MGRFSSSGYGGLRGWAGVLAVSAWTTFGCDDDSSSAGPNASPDAGGINLPPGTPGTPSDGGDAATLEASTEAGGATFSPKSNCQAPAVAFTVPISLSSFSLAAAPGSPVIAGYGSLARAGGASYRCEARTYSAGTWSAPDPTFEDCDDNWLRVASGGGHAIAFSRDRLPMISRRRRTTGAAFADMGSATASAQNREVSIGPSGHTVDTSMSSSGLSTVLYDASANEVILPPNPAPSSAVMSVANVIDANGDGFVVWLTSSPPTLHARAFRNRAWAGEAVTMATGVTGIGQTTAMSAALLSNGDVEVVWFNAGGTSTPAVRGTQVRHDTAKGTTAWGATIDEIDPDTVTSQIGKVLADGDGNLTVLWVGGGDLHARRRVAGTWGKAESLGSAQYLSAIIEPQGHVTAITFDAAQGLYHHRVERGAAAWQARVKVNGTVGASDSAGLVVDPSTGELLIAWRDSGKNIYSTICR